MCLVEPNAKVGKESYRVLLGAGIQEGEAPFKRTGVRNRSIETRGGCKTREEHQSQTYRRFTNGSGNLTGVAASYGMRDAEGVKRRDAQHQQSKTCTIRDRVFILRM